MMRAYPASFDDRPHPDRAVAHSQDAPKRRIQLVRNAGCQLAHRHQLLARRNAFHQLLVLVMSCRISTPPMSFSSSL